MLIILSIVDSLRADAPGFAGGRAHTPFMDGLADEGARFTDVVVSGSWTIPSILAMLTGSYPHRVGLARWRHLYPEGRPNLLLAFEQAGFEVRCLTPYPDRDLLTVPGASRRGRSQATEEVTAALRGRRGQDRFILIHHWWTHLPYLQRALDEATWHLACEFQLASLRRNPVDFSKILEGLYHDAIAHFSEELLPRYLDAATAGGDQVLLVLTGDHGENWGASLPDGGRAESLFDLHGRWLTDETTRVPLVAWGSAATGPISAGQRIVGTARGVDLGPTIAELAGVPWPTVDPRDKRDGESLARSLINGQPTGRTEAMVVSSHNTHEPAVYPEEGPALWRTIGLRTPGHWFVWDGVDEEGEIRAVEGAPATDETPAEEIFRRLEVERQRAIAPAGLIEPPHPEVTGRLATLGYLD